MVRKDGTRIWIDASGVMLSGEQDLAMLLLADITPMKQAEEIRIRAIALQSQNAQLIAANQVKDEFLANMSHELRTPLNAVIGFASLLQSGAVKADSPKYPVYLSQIGASGQHLLQLITQMLDFAKVESGKMTFEPEPVDLGAAIADVLEMLQVKLEARHLRTQTTVDPALGVVCVDPLRLRQVLLNYVDNAIKFSHEGGVVSVRALPEGPASFRVEVEDGGIVIAEADVPRLFVQFLQLSSGNTKSHGGTGLGLAIVRKVVEAQGGTVSVRSTLGVGSVFSLVLPRQQDATSGD
jgi:signal transduction histidine kinase